MEIKTINHHKRINDYNSPKWIYIGLLLGCIICCWTILKSGYAMGAIVACLPFILLVGFYIFQKPIIILIVLFTVNYFIMGLNRYNLISVPISAIIDSILGFLILSIVVKSSFNKLSWKESRNVFTGINLLWFIYCLVQIMNNTAGSVNIEAWYQGVRNMAVYPLTISILIPLVIRKYNYIQYFLILWAFCSLLGAMKGYWQRSHGFDNYELSWLYNYGGRTHLISTGIRYFSFFTDANTYGASMGLSMVVFSIASVYSHRKLLKVFYLITALACTYGLIISGTRGALAVPVAGYILFILISRNWKMVTGCFAVLLLSFVFLKFTTVGNDNMFIKRMRSVFDTNDASFQARVINRENLSKDMRNLPLGIGIGIGKEDIKYDNRYYTAATTPPDSWYVTIWTRTGVVGLSIYLSVLAFTILYGSYLLMFRVKNKELKGILSGMLCGVFGVMISAYSGDCYTQFPNGFIIYTCQTLVLIAPFFDKELTKKKKQDEQYLQVNNLLIIAKNGKNKS